MRKYFVVRIHSRIHSHIHSRKQRARLSCRHEPLAAVKLINIMPFGSAANLMACCLQRGI